VGTAAEITECWSDAFSRTYMSLAYGDVEHTEGDAAACPYADAERPDFEALDPDAFADDDLVAALPQPADLDLEPAAVDDPAAEPATWFVVARTTVAGLTHHVGGVIDLVRDITRHPPSDCEPDACTWGPYTNWEEGTTFLLAVHREEEGAFAFELRGKRFGAPADEWRTAIAGGFVDADGDDNGQGWFDYDLGVVADLDPDEETRGSFRAEFARMDDEGQLAVRLDGVETSEEPEPVDARYFVGATAAGGLLELRIPHDTDEDGSARETLEGTVRWRANGAGVANIRAADGDLGDEEVLVVECWDRRAAQRHIAFVRQDAGAGELPEIDPEACVFPDWLAPVLAPMGDELAGS